MQNASLDHGKAQQIRVKGIAYYSNQYKGNNLRSGNGNQVGMKEFTKQLLSWYDSHARILPWREDPHPYKVWISEVMLQQTRVVAVIPYFDRFMEQFPDVASLARANQEEINKAWQGLGYYSRAKNLKKTAELLMQNYGGKLPSDPDQLLTLPGIGPYTAAAIASIAFNLPLPAMDGNLLRVWSRMVCYENEIGSAAAKRDLATLCRESMPEARAGDYNQALMELGATICLPNGAPLCPQCPISRYCCAHSRKREETYPKKKEKKARVAENRTVLCIQHKTKTAIRKRPKKGLLASLWEFPSVEGWLDESSCREMVESLGLQIKHLEIGPDGKHIFTHREWNMKSYFIEVVHPIAYEDWVWVTKEESEAEYAIPNAFRIWRDHIWEEGANLEL